MNKQKALRTDFWVQLTGVILLIATAILSRFFGQMLSWSMVVLLMLVIWQFFSGIYIAVEFKMWYRGVPSGGLLVLVTLAILFAASQFTIGLFIALCIFPLILLSNLAMAAADWYRLQHKKRSRWHPPQETILDAEDIFI